MPDPKIFNEIADLLEPFLVDENARRSLIEPTFIGERSRPPIDYSGAARVFTRRLVQDLLTFGTLSTGEQALAALLENLRDQVGLEKQHQIDNFQQAIRASSNTVTSPTAPSPRVEATPTPALTAKDTSEPKKADAGSPNRILLVVALIGAAATIVAALIGIVPPLLNARQTTPTNVPTTTSAPGTVVAVAPTAVPTETASATVDFIAAAQTFDAQSTAAVKATSLVQTQLFIAGQTATATLWTKTPTPTLTLTPNITASFQMFLTQRAQTQIAQNAVNQAATATLWTRTPTPTPTETNTPTATPYPIASTNKAWTPITKTFNDGVEMVLVPKGCFMMGSTDFTDTQPVSKICFDQPFWIDKTDVTQSQFRHLGGMAHNSHFTGDNRPVENITWFEANAYCVQKRGARLPTEAEWEYAARGPDSWIYPWGTDTPTYDKAVYNTNQTADVSSKPKGMSWVGAYDMAGNVWQWTSTIYDPSNFPYPYKSDDGRESSTNLSSNRVLRGGSWNDIAPQLRMSFRYGDVPSFALSNLGFRCARS